MHVRLAWLEDTLGKFGLVLSIGPHLQHISELQQAMSSSLLCAPGQFDIRMLRYTCYGSSSRQSTASKLAQLLFLRMATSRHDSMVPLVVCLATCTLARLT